MQFKQIYFSILLITQIVKKIELTIIYSVVIFMNIQQLSQYGSVKPYFHNYVSEGLSMSTLVEWSQHPHVGNLIIAPTGLGKTHFIEQVLFRHAYNQKQKILIVTNRTALDQQIKSRILTISTETIWLQPTKSDIDISVEPSQAKKIQLNPALSQSLRDRFLRMTFPPLTIYIVKYQNLNSFLSLEESKNISYVVFDETHFFTSDVLFNPYTGYLLAKAQRHFFNAVRIYMTATPDTIIRPLAQIENLNICYFPPKPAHYQVHYFASINNLLPSIAQSPIQEQWLIFVNSKSDGKSLKKILDLQLGTNQTVYLDSTSKKNKAWKHIIDHSSFDRKVLICTSVLDNGVNLSEQRGTSSRNIRHIVLPPCEHDTFMQMLGRKRMPPDFIPEIHLYIQALTPIQLNHHKQTTLHCAKAIYEWLQLFPWPNQNIVYSNILEKIISHPLVHMSSYYQTTGLSSEFSQPESTHKLIKKYWRQGDQHIQNLFYICSINNTLTLSLNKLAVYRLYTQQEFYKQLDNLAISAYSANKLAVFPALAMQWLGLHYEDGDWIFPTTDFMQIEQEICQKALNNPMSAKQFKEFYHTIISKYLTIPRIHRRGIGIKHDGKNNMSDLNKLLSHIHTLTPNHPKYKFHKRNNQFILEIDKQSASESS